MVALTGSGPPQGHARWTMQLPADKLAELAVFDAVGGETVRRALKKTNCGRTARSSG